MCAEYDIPTHHDRRHLRLPPLVGRQLPPVEHPLAGAVRDALVHELLRLPNDDEHGFVPSVAFSRHVSGRDLWHYYMCTTNCAIYLIPGAFLVCATALCTRCRVSARLLLTAWGTERCT